MLLFTKKTIVRRIKCLKQIILSLESSGLPYMMTYQRWTDNFSGVKGTSILRYWQKTRCIYLKLYPSWFNVWFRQTNTIIITCAFVMISWWSFRRISACTFGILGMYCVNIMMIFCALYNAIFLYKNCLTLTRWFKMKWRFFKTVE